MASATAEDLLGQLHELPAEDRARVAREMIDSLDDSEDADAEALWATEIDKRAQEVTDGTVELEDGDQVLAELRSELDGKSKVSPASRRSR